MLQASRDIKHLDAVLLKRSFAIPPSIYFLRKLFRRIIVIDTN